MRPYSPPAGRWTQDTACVQTGGQRFRESRSWQGPESLPSWPALSPGLPPSGMALTGRPPSWPKIALNLMTWQTSPFKLSFASARHGVSIDPTVRGQPAASGHSRGSPRAPGPYHRGGQPSSPAPGPALSPQGRCSQLRAFHWSPPQQAATLECICELICTSASAQPCQWRPRKTHLKKTAKEETG